MRTRVCLAAILAASPLAHCRENAVLSQCGASNHLARRAVPGMDVQVVTGSGWYPLVRFSGDVNAPGVNFCVRAETASGDVFEARTDANGVAHLPIDPSAGPWDITAGRVGFQAVSILGVDAPIGRIYSDRTQPSSSATPTLTVTIPDGLVAGEVRLALDLMPFMSWTHDARGTHFSTQMPSTHSSSVMDVLGIATAADGTRQSFRAQPVGPTDRDVQLALATSPTLAPISVVRSFDVPITLPAGWLVAPQAPGVLSGCGLVRGCGPSYPCTFWVGGAPIRVDPGTGHLLCSLSISDGEFRPEAAVAEINVARTPTGNPPRVWLSYRSFDAAVPIVVPDVPVSSAAGSGVDTTMHFDAPGVTSRDLCRAFAHA